MLALLFFFYNNFNFVEKFQDRISRKNNTNISNNNNKLKLKFNPFEYTSSWTRIDRHTDGWNSHMRVYFKETENNKNSNETETDLIH